MILLWGGGGVNVNVVNPLPTGSNTLGVVNLGTTDASNISAIKIATEAIGGTVDVSGTELRVNVTTSLPTGSNTIGVVDLGTTDSTALAAVKNAVESMDTAFSGTGATVNLGTTDTAALAAVKTSVEALDNTIAISGTELRVDLVTSLPSGSNTIGVVNLGTTDSTNLAAIKTAVETLDNAISGANMNVNVTNAIDLGTTDTGNLAAVKTAVESTAGAVAISGTELRVDVVTSLPSGSNTIGSVNLGATDSSTLAAVKTSVESIEGAIAGSGTELQVNVINPLPSGSNTIGVVNLGATDAANLAAIKTSIETLDNAIAGNEVQVDIVGPLPSGSNSIGNVGVTSVVPGTAATSLGKAVDSVAGETDTGVAILAVRDDALSTLTPAEGDYVTLRVNAEGALHVTSSGGATAAVQYNEDTSHVSGDKGVLTLAVRNDTEGTLVSTNGDYSSLQIDGVGALRVSDSATRAVLGTASDAAIITDSVGTVAGWMRGMVKWAYERMPSSLGQKTSATSLPVVLPSDQIVKTSPDLARAAFGETLVANLDVRSIISFSYGINPDLTKTTLTGIGAAVSESRMLKISTGASASSSAAITSKRVVNYQPGMGAVARFTAIFTPGAAGSEQWAGLGLPSEDGFFVGYNGVNFCICKVRTGVKEFVNQTAWNRDKGDGTKDLPVLDWTKGNVFEIKFQWLGFGAITFSIEDNDRGIFTPVHVIEYANANTLTSVDNPSFPLYAGVTNTTNTSNIILRSGCLAGYIEGNYRSVGPIFSKANNLLSPTTTYTNILTIRNKSIFKTYTNRKLARILELSIDSDGGKNGTFRLVLNATVGGTPSWTDIDANASSIEWDVSGTTVTGGRILKTVRCAKLESKDIDISNLYLEIYPGDTLTLAYSTDAGTNKSAGGSITWRESL